jgi:isoleucyl-tRNA synthetase
VVFVDDSELMQLLRSVDMAEVSITSQLTLKSDAGPDEAFRLPDVAGITVVPEKAEGKRCARSWKILKEVGLDPAYPDLSLRDAAAMREFDAARQAAE